MNEQQENLDQMNKEQVTMPDGERYMFFYTFRGQQIGVEESAAASVESKETPSQGEVTSSV